MCQLYYKAAVVDPYILLNYGTTNLEELYQAEIEPQEFLAKEASSEELSDIETKVTTAAGEDRGKKKAYRVYIQPTKAVYKAVVGSMVPLLNLSIGLPLVVIGMIGLSSNVGVVFITCDSFFITRFFCSSI